MMPLRIPRIPKSWREQEDSYAELLCATSVGWRIWLIVRHPLRGIGEELQAIAVTTVEVLFAITQYPGVRVERATSGDVADEVVPSFDRLSSIETMKQKTPVARCRPWCGRKLG